MMPKPISPVSAIPMRVVIVTMDSHLSGAVMHAVTALRRELPGLTLVVHAADQWGSDEVALAACHLAAAGHRVGTTRSGAEALDALRRERYDLLVVSATLPDVSGAEILRRLRLRDVRGVAGAPLDATAVLVVLDGAGGRGARDASRLAALADGADDALERPVVYRELLLRAAAILRRLPGDPAAAERVVVGPITVDVPAHEVTVAGARVALTPTAFALLRTLATRPGELHTRAQLHEALWGDTGGPVRRRAVDLQISRLRARLGAAGPLIETVLGEGYRLRRPARGRLPNDDASRAVGAARGRGGA